MSPEKPSRADEIDLAVESERMVQEALWEGVISLVNGTQIKLDKADVVKLIQWGVTQRARKRKVVEKPEDFSLGKTGG